MDRHLVAGDKLLQLPYALHGSNKSIILTVKALVLGGPGPGVPAVLTDGVMWYSADLVSEADEPLVVAYAVNGYQAKDEAERDALHR